jgi:hypothetical protein
MQKVRASGPGRAAGEDFAYAVQAVATQRLFEQVAG